MKDLRGRVRILCGTPGREIRAVFKDVITVNGDVADVDANPKGNLYCVRVSLWHPALPQPSDDLELSLCSRSCCPMDQVAVGFPDSLDCVSRFTERRQRRHFIESAVAT